MRERKLKKLNPRKHSLSSAQLLSVEIQDPMK